MVCKASGKSGMSEYGMKSSLFPESMIRLEENVVCEIHFVTLLTSHVTLAGK